MEGNKLITIPYSKKAEVRVFKEKMLEIINQTTSKHFLNSNYNKEFQNKCNKRL